MNAGLSRRGLIAGGGALIVSFSLRGAFAETPAPPQMPGDLKSQPLLDAWIKIAADGKVTVFTGKVELGQGVKTAILQLAAEELDLDPHTVTIVTADTDKRRTKATPPAASRWRTAASPSPTPPRRCARS